MKQGLFRKMLAAVTVVGLILAIAACGGSKNTDTQSGNTAGSKEPSPSASAPQSSEPAKEKVKLKALIHTSWYKGGIEAVLKEAAEKEGIEVEFEKLPEGGDGDNLIKTRFATNDKPDILFYFAGYGESGGLGVPSDIFAVQDDQPWMQNFDKVAWKNLMDNLKDGHWYGAPYGGANLGVVLYNKKVFQDLNLQIPTSIDEFWTLSETIKKAGKIPLYLSGKDSWTLQLPPLMANATQATVELTKKLNVNQAKVADMTDRRVGAQFLKDVVDRGYTNKDILSDSYDDAQKALANGDAAMYMMGTWVMTDIATKFPDQVADIGSFVMPFKGNGADLAALFTPNAVYVVKGEKQEDAQRFVNFFESLDMQNLYFSNEGGIPAIRGVSKTSLTDAELDAKKYVDDGKALGNVPYPPLYNFDAILPGLLQELIVKNGKSIDQVLEALQKELEKDAKAAGDPNFK